MLCPMSKSPSGKREGFQDNATRKKREVYCWLKSGLPLRIQRSGTGSESTEPKLLPNLYDVHKQLVAGLRGLVTCLQSNLTGPNLRGLFSNLGIRGLFSFPLIGSLFLARRMLIGLLQVTWWGRGIPPFQVKPKPRSGQPASPGSPTITKYTTLP